MLNRRALTLAVLVVEDIATCLLEAGYLVIEAASGEEAISICKSEVPIDMVFTDINLGGMTSGWDVAECFRAERPDVPLLYVSGEVINPERCVPGSVFVAKPYRHTDVLSACQRLRAR
jgi:CheY-like chemotaxis protein